MDAADYLASLLDDALPGWPEDRPPGLNERSATSGELPLHIYAVRGDLDACRALLKAGSEVDVPGEHGCTPLHEAALQGHHDVVQLLLAHGADPSLRCEFGNLQEINKYAADPPAP